METLRFSFLALVIGVFVSAPSMAQQPRRGNADPFGGSSSHTDDPFSNGPNPPRKRGSAEVMRANPEANAKADAAGALTAEDKIRKELNNKTSVHFIEAPLSDVIMQLSQTHDIPIVIDSRALEEIGLSSDEPVNLSLKNISLRSALRLLLANHDLTHMIRSEVLIITTAEAAEQNLGLRVFLIPASLIGHEDEVIKAVQATIVPDIWEVTGGPASIVCVKNTLVVSATDSVLDDVEALLQRIAATTTKTADSKRDPSATK